MVSLKKVLILCLLSIVIAGLMSYVALLNAQAMEYSPTLMALTDHDMVSIALLVTVSSSSLYVLMFLSLVWLTTIKAGKKFNDTVGAG
jgi:hypothetical protein